MEGKQEMMNTVLSVCQMLEDEVVKNYMGGNESLATAKGILARLVLMISNSTEKRKDDGS